MEKIMNVENEWDQMVDANMVEGPVEGVTDEEVIEAMNKMKSSWTLGSKYGYDNSKWKVWCWSNEEALSENPKWERYARRMENKCCCSNL